MTSTAHVTPGPISVRPLTARDFARWNLYVRSHAEGTFFHLSGWHDVLRGALGHRPYYMLAEAAGEIVGVLPLGQIRSRIFGNALISTPFCVYGGVLASNEAAFHALERAAVELAERLGVDHLEMRNRKRAHPDWPCSDLYVYFAKSLAADVEKNLLAIPRKQRAMVRKGIKAGLIGEIDAGVDRFYDMYSESVRNLGTPVLPRGYFAALRRVFGDACEVLTVTHERRPIASVLSFYFRDQVLPYYGGGTTEARNLAGNDFLYWDLMRRSVERGVRLFDYGRSKRDVGSFEFKKHWGFEPAPLFYEYYLVRSRELPNLNPLNPKYHQAIELWKKLPLWASRLLGPPIARNLG